MTRPKLTVLISILTIATASSAHAQKLLTTAEAKDHIGQSATVCGDVVSTRYATRSRGNPTFINLDKPYPNQVFTLLIWGNDRPKFGNPEEMYGKKHICATGKVTDFKGVPEIVASDPAQVTVK